MILGSCLTGLGGMDLGFHAAGWSIAWQIESDPFRRAVLQRAWPKAACRDDIFTVNPQLLTPVDCIVTDCPGHEYAKPHPVFAAVSRIVAHLAPHYWIVQVPIATLTRDNGADWHALMEAVARLGYTLAQMQMSYAPHAAMRWERQFLLGYRGAVPAAVQQFVHRRLHFGLETYPVDDEEACLRYGALREGDIVQGERDWCFPAGWSDVPGVTLGQRCMAVAESTPTVAGMWWGRTLNERNSHA